MQPGETKRPWEQRLQDAGVRVEEELRRLTTYINDEVIPDVRRHSSHALRSAAQELQRLAQHLDDQKNAQQAPPSQPGPGGKPQP